MDTLFSLSEVIKEWERLSYKEDPNMSFDVYLRKEYTPVYDLDLKLIGYEKGNMIGG